MTAGEVMARADALMPNQFEAEEKFRWLEHLDMTLAEELPQLGEPQGDFYAGESVLLAPDAHGELYIHWLHAKMLYYLGEFTRYQNAMAQFNSAYLGLTAALIRKGAPKGDAALRY
ncbi:MAG: hypothetical protein IIY16_01490 [Oscillospiraceae bacterium]|nr:hypothetical protein [Oscillospiraceae bacterium]